MAKDSAQAAVAFAQAGDFSQMRAFAGDVLYTEGMPANQLYVILDGEVDLYLVRDEKRTVVETLRKGQCFGVEPHLNQPLRVHNAAARTYCELSLIDQRQVSDAVHRSHSLARGLLHTLSERLATAHRLIARRVNYQPDLIVYAQLLHLLGVAELGKQAVALRPASSQDAPQAKPLLQEVVNNARLMFGHSDRHIQGCIGTLARLHLVRIEDEQGQGKRVLFSPRDIVSQVRKAVGNDTEADKLSYEYLSLDDFAALVDVDRSVVLRKLAGGEFADDLFTFRRAEILRLLDEKGRRYFAERKIKSPKDFAEVADLEFADQKALFAAVSKLDSLDLAKLLAHQEQGPVRSKILGALSRRRREEVEEDLQGLAADPMDAQQIGAALVQQVKTLMTQAATA
ncbi:MAG: cyclic nucleotide-binding domain-containing protein [Burkholderiaceae bacterium]